MIRVGPKPAVLRIFSIFGIGPAIETDISIRTIAINQNRH